MAAAAPEGLIRRLNSTAPDTNAPDTNAPDTNAPDTTAWARYERNELDTDGFRAASEAEAAAARHRLDATGLAFAGAAR